MKLPKFVNIIKKLSDGDVFFRYFYFLIISLVIVTIINAVFISKEIWEGYYARLNQLNNITLESSGIIYFVIIQIILVFYWYAMVRVFLIKANIFRNLSIDNQYKLMPSFAILIKMCGEFLFLKYLIIGVLCAITLFMNFNPDFILFHLGDLPFSLFFKMFGVEDFTFAYLINGFLFSSLSLALAYFIAEQIMVFVDISNNTKNNKLQP
jgi:mannose/fructose/N-acetylgalactosamine-specific phosphotransferase system component IIC